MESFLATVARRLRADHPSDLEQVIVVFNNRRSGLFLRQQFTEQSDSPLFLPQIIGIDDLVSQLGRLEIVPNEFLLFELFDIHRALAGEERKFETFEEFISFGDMLLSDFSEIDLYCVDARQLFENLHDEKALSEWNPEAGALTPFQEKYLSFYKSLYHYYDQLHKRLSSQGKAYSGMAYRTVAENISTLADNLECSHIYFVGFNALSECEMRIIQQYVRMGRGTFLPDGDDYYLSDPNQEAGNFLRKYRQKFPAAGAFHNHFSEGEKDITLISCPENLLQCKYAGDILHQLNQQEGESFVKQTALVLADESLLIPTLNSLPPNVCHANVTMGFPFPNTAVHSLMLKLFSLHQQRRGTKYHYKDLQDLLTDYCLAPILHTGTLYGNLLKKFSDSHIIYADVASLKELCQPLRCTLEPIEFLFTEEAPDPDTFLALTHKLIQLIYLNKTLEHNRKEKEALACLLQIVEHFQELQQKYHFVQSLSVLLKIYSRIAKRRTVAFYGEPLQGLQILGMLETRNLDFKRVILLSANEGTIPASRSTNTLIPYTLKRAFHIPTYHEKDAVYAYNFYHLLQRAEEIYILYHTESDGMGKGEPSRFVMQVRNELAQRYPDHIHLHEKVLSAANQATRSLPKDSHEKDDATCQRLIEMAKNGFSPSALNKYRGCPLKFYYENVLLIKEPTEMHEDIDQSEMGTCIHAILSKIYSGDADHHVRKETLLHQLENLDELTRQVFEEEGFSNYQREGRSHFLESVIKTQVTKFVQGEIRQLEKGCQIKILGLERTLEQSLSMSDESLRKNALIIGTADRIDNTDGFVRVIDYKSGSVTDSELNVAAGELNPMKIPDKWFQVMTYSWLYDKTKESSQPLLPGILPLQRLNAQLLPVTWGKALPTKEHLAKFEVALKNVVSDILNPAIPFFANHDSSLCKYCPFAETCK